MTAIIYKDLLADELERRERAGTLPFADPMKDRMWNAGSDWNLPIQQFAERLLTDKGSFSDSIDSLQEPVEFTENMNESVSMETQFPENAIAEIENQGPLGRHSDGEALDTDWATEENSANLHDVLQHKAARLDIRGNIFNDPETAADFKKGFVSGATATFTLLKHEEDLARGDRRAEGVQQAYEIIQQISTNSFADMINLAFDNIKRNKAYAAGRTAGSLALGYVVGGGAGGKAAKQGLKSIGLGSARARIALGGTTAVANFTASQLSGGLNALYSLADQTALAGLGIDLLSIDAIGSAFYAGTAGLDLDYDSKTGLLGIGHNLGTENALIEVEICANPDLCGAGSAADVDMDNGTTDE